MNRRFIWRTWHSLLLLTALLVIMPSGANAQSSAPQFKSLTVALWPEYDRPEVLVIYRAQLSAETPLPARLTFRLPGHLEEMHAVAVEQDGALMYVDPNSIELIDDNNELMLTFPTPSRNIQFEYYDPMILVKQDQTRKLIFDFTAPSYIEMATFEVKQPAQAEDFALVPEPISTFIGDDGLKHSEIEVAQLTPNDTFELSATYYRNTDEASVKSLAGEAPGSPSSVSVLIEPSSTGNRFWGYAFAGAGAILLLGTGGYWWVRQTKSKTGLRFVSKKNSRRRVRRKKGRRTKRTERRSAPSAATRPPVPPASSFCYRCGVALRADANFCHACGAERRRA